MLITGANRLGLPTAFVKSFCAASTKNVFQKKIWVKNQIFTCNFSPEIFQLENGWKRRVCLNFTHYFIAVYTGLSRIANLPFVCLLVCLLDSGYRNVILFMTCFFCVLIFIEINYTILKCSHYFFIASTLGQNESQPHSKSNRRKFLKKRGTLRKNQMNCFIFKWK